MWRHVCVCVCMCVHTCVCLCSLSCGQFFVTSWTVACWLLCPWNIPYKNTRAGYHFILQRIFLTQGLNPSLLLLLHWQENFLPLCHLGSLRGSYSKEKKNKNTQKLAIWVEWILSSFYTILNSSSNFVFKFCVWEFWGLLRFFFGSVKNSAFVALLLGSGKGSFLSSYLQLVWEDESSWIIVEWVL